MKIILSILILFISVCGTAQTELDTIRIFYNHSTGYFEPFENNNSIYDLEGICKLLDFPEKEQRAQLGGVLKYIVLEDSIINLNQISKGLSTMTENAINYYSVKLNNVYLEIDLNNTDKHSLDVFTRHMKNEVSFYYGINRMHTSHSNLRYQDTILVENFEFGTLTVDSISVLSYNGMPISRYSIQNIIYNKDKLLLTFFIILYDEADKIIRGKNFKLKIRQ